MIHLLFRRVIIAVSSLALFAGCGAAPANVKNNVQTPVYPVSCIAVIPAVPVVDIEGKTSPEQQKALDKGVQVMNKLLAQELGARDTIIIVNTEQMSSLELTGGENMKDIARLVGQSVNCNAVLETSIRRYSERIGTKWSVERAASVAFEMRLIGVDAGKILWTAKFDEEQIPLMDNLYHLSKARTRGFTWITADELMLEGMREKFSNSPYFQQLSPEKDDMSKDHLEDRV